MSLWIDADGCPVVGIAVDKALAYGVESVIVKNHAHEISHPGARVVTVDISPDGADYYIANRLQAGDLLITQDYGLAAMALAKKASVLTQDGLVIDEGNIQGLLGRRHAQAELRRKHRIYSRQKKRDKTRDEAFLKGLTDLLEKL
jgi:hypothetical protein